MSRPGPHDQDARVDELRRQLRSLGYLDAGVDRFVLGPAREARAPAAIAALASIRIAAIAALLTGPAAAIGVAARIPGLITGPRDGFVVAAYMGLLFGGGVWIASVLATLAASWLVARNRAGGAGGRRRVATAAGAVITAACLAYLTLWWDASTFGSTTGGWNLFWTISGLAFAAAISLLLGHLVTVAALAVTVASTGMGDQAPGVPGTSRRVIAMASVLTFAGALLLFSLTSRMESASVEAAPLTVVPSGLRVRLFAIDGFDPGVATRLAQEGRIPSLAAALRLSAAATDAASGQLRTARATIAAHETRDPARAWTTTATGQPPEVHAVRGLETRRVIGLQGTLASGEPSPLARALAAASDLVRLTRPSVASGDQRRVKTLWEVAASAGLRTAVINWWATWPAPSDSGIVVTDRAILRLERGGDLDAEIAPPDVYDRLRQQWPALRQRGAETAATIHRTDDAGGLLRRSAELDALQLAIAGEIGSDSLDLLCTYLPGLDVVQHALLTSAEGTALSPSAIAQRLDALEEYYVFLDALIARYIRPQPGELTVVVTSPGRVQASAPAILSISGAVANDRAQDAVARPTDVMPTVLHVLGVPISRELQGRALVELLSADFARRYPVRAVNTYGRPAIKQAPRGGTPLDQEMIDRLRSLGYVR